MPIVNRREAGCARDQRRHYKRTAESANDSSTIHHSTLLVAKEEIAHCRAVRWQ